MTTRRDFVRNVATATAGAFLGGRGLVDAGVGLLQGPAAARRQVSIGGRRVEGVDGYAPTLVPGAGGVGENNKTADGAHKKLTAGTALRQPAGLLYLGDGSVDQD